MRRARALSLALVAAGALGFVVGPARAAEGPASGILERVAPSIVAVHAVFQAKITYQGQSLMDQEMPAPGLGVVVDPTGLIAVGDVGHLTRAFEQGMQGLSLTLSPRSIKVTFPGEAKEHDAVLVVRDSTLGVAFLQVLELGDRRLPFVDLSKGGADPRLGQDLLGVRRLGRGFDHAPEVLRLSVAETIAQPRRMWGLRGDFQEHGLPAFDASGAPVGLVTLQFGSEGVDMSSLVSSGNMPARFCLLPLDVIRPLVERARKRVPEAVEKARGAKEAAPSEGGAAMDAPAMDGGGMEGGGSGTDGAAMEGAPPSEKGLAPR